MKLIDDDIPKEYLLQYINTRGRIRMSVGAAIGMIIYSLILSVVIFFLLNDYFIKISSLLSSLHITYCACRYVIQKNPVKKEIQKWYFTGIMNVYISLTLTIAAFYILKNIRNMQNTSYSILVFLIAVNAIIGWGFLKLINYAVKRGIYAGIKDKFLTIIINATVCIVAFFWLFLLPFVEENIFLLVLIFYDYSLLFSLGSISFLKSYYVKYLEKINDTYGIKFD